MMNRKNISSELIRSEKQTLIAEIKNKVRGWEDLIPNTRGYLKPIRSVINLANFRENSEAQIIEMQFVAYLLLAGDPTTKEYILQNLRQQTPVRGGTEYAKELTPIKADFIAKNEALYNAAFEYLSGDAKDAAYQEIATYIYFPLLIKAPDFIKVFNKILEEIQASYNTRKEKMNKQNRLFSKSKDDNFAKITNLI